MIILIGRGRSGTRIIPQLLIRNGVFMGGKHAASGRKDLLPATNIYDMAYTAGHRVFRDGLSWDFKELVYGTLPAEMHRKLAEYLVHITPHKEPKGWKLPENTLIYPWLVRMFPEGKFIYLIRDPRDVILSHHFTDDLTMFNIDMPKTKNIYRQRALSWLYQYYIVSQTPKPKHFIQVHFEDLLTHTERVVGQLSDFLDVPLPNLIRVNPEKIGQWKESKEFTQFDFLEAPCKFNNYDWS